MKLLSIIIMLRGSCQFHSAQHRTQLRHKIRKDTDASRSGPPWGMGIRRRRHHIYDIPGDYQDFIGRFLSLPSDSI